MRSARFTRLGRRFATLSTLALVLGSAGCASIVDGTTQSVRLVTNPPGQTVTFEGRSIADGEMIYIQKRQELPFVTANGNRFDLTYDPNPWLVADAGLLLLYVVPGLVAGGVDFATGAWRRFHDPQVIYLPDAE